MSESRDVTMRIYRASRLYRIIRFRVSERLNDPVFCVETTIGLSLRAQPQGSIQAALGVTSISSCPVVSIAQLAEGQAVCASFKVCVFGFSTN